MLVVFVTAAVGNGNRFLYWEWGAAVMNVEAALELGNGQRLEECEKHGKRSLYCFQLTVTNMDVNHAASEEEKTCIILQNTSSGMNTLQGQIWV